MGDAGEATATDNCDPDPVVTSSDVTISERCPIIIERTWVATDSCGNADTCVQTITIQDITDPVVTCPRDTTFDCTAGNSGTATATDNCDPDPDVTSSDVTTSARCPIIIERTWTATDTCGNDVSCVQTITVQDTAKPTISCPANDTVACGAAVFFGDPTADDNCDPDPEISIVSDVVTPGPAFGETTYTRTWKATDSCDNASATCSQSILKEACPTGKLTPTDVACSDFVNGTAGDLTQVCYKVKSGFINNVAPGVFFYYTSVSAPSANFTIDIVQTKNNGSFPFLGVHNGEIRLYNANCTVIGSGTETSLGQASVNVSGATVGQTFIVGIKYNPGSVVGTAVVTPGPTVHYDFHTEIGGLTVDLDPDGLDLKDCTGGATSTSAGNASSQLDLQANYPNPFNANTTIKYSLPNDGKVNIAVYNILGQRVITLVDAVKSAGYHTVIWNGKNASGNSIASGVYFYMIKFENQTQIKRMTLLK
jgi:hypothetical protein